ncbi:PEP/pyruvate-binding domain-containing protein [Bacillus sp. SCS-151]|uniref:PEP/pyruvate-binding domain-containing protein n=1 Tax=Nanhaiella sioensis TaxID=3115293 RepID=UPI00397D1484
MIRWFYEIGEEDFQAVGGKGYNLSKMYNQGLNVPNGFVITSDAYNSYIQKNFIGEKISRILNEETSTKEKSLTIKSLFTKELFSIELQKHIEDQLTKIASKRVAVRSSSTVEDLPGMSFAGQYSTYLNVTRKDIIDKVLLCWQSLWNERAIDYRTKYDVTSDFTHSVVIQEMINSKLSGIVFTANPITGNRNEIYINGSYGLGEAIVSGEVNPDQYTVAKSNGKVLIEELSSKERLCQYGEDGIEYVPIRDGLKNGSSLENLHIESIVKEAIKLEAYFSKPQDIEFAIDHNDELYIVQSRDITSLFPIDSFIQDKKLRAYLSVSTVMLGMKEPFTPLGFELFGHMVPTIVNVMTSRNKPLDGGFVKEAGGRIFADITYLLANKFVGKQFAKAFAGNDLPLEGTMNAVLKRHGKQFTNQGIKFKIPWGIIKYAISMVKPYVEANKIASEDRYGQMKKIGHAVVEEHMKLACSLQTVEEKLDFIKDTLVNAFILSQKQALYCVEFANFSKISKKLSKMLGDDFDIVPLTKSFPNCITVELGMELNYLAKYFDEEGIEPTKNHPKVRQLLKEFGHRSTIELDFGVKRWSEDPAYIMNLIKSYMVDQMYNRNIEEVHGNAQKADQLINEIYERIKVLKGKRRARKMRKMIIDYRIAAGMREYPKFDIVRMLALAREVMLEVGQLYEQQGLIEDQEDVFFLRTQDIRSREQLRLTILTNKEVYKREFARTTIPRIVLNTGETYYSAQNVDPHSKILQGVPLSAGIYEGKVRVIFDPNKAELLEGEILVTESTNPAWTPLFMTAKGLIMEYGGPVSHGGIVAREYGIPAVVGIPSATATLKDGQMVRINGETGTVEILKQQDMTH